MTDHQDDLAERSLAAMRELDAISYRLPGESLRSLGRVPAWLQIKPLRKRVASWSAILISVLRRGAWSR